MRSALVVLNARDIPVCSRSLDALNIPKIRLTGWTEKQIADVAMPWVLKETDFDDYVMVADDVIVRQHALDHVIDLLEVTDAEVATGWCQRSHTDWQTNVTRSPLKGAHPEVGAYDFYDTQEIVSMATPRFRTWFSGMALTGMSRQMWQQYPFQCYHDDDLSKAGYGSDFKLAFRLQADSVPILCHRDAFVYHWRHEWRHTNDSRDDRLIVGKVEPTITVTV